MLQNLGAGRQSRPTCFLSFALVTVIMIISKKGQHCALNCLGLYPRSKNALVSSLVPRVTSAFVPALQPGWSFIIEGPQSSRSVLIGRYHAIWSVQIYRLRSCDDTLPQLVSADKRLSPHKLDDQVDNFTWWRELTTGNNATKMASEIASTKLSQ
jgi:hypothetical protein